jgi:hypothetical protein
LVVGGCSGADAVYAGGSELMVWGCRIAVDGVGQHSSIAGWVWCACVHTCMQQRCRSGLLAARCTVTAAAAAHCWCSCVDKAAAAADCAASMQGMIVLVIVMIVVHLQ